jgi:hypothetical protein
MATDVEPPQPDTLFNRTIARRRSAAATLALVAVVILPTVLAASNLGLAALLADRHDRAVFAAPVVIAYILVVAPIMSGMEAAVVRSLRPIIQVDEGEFQRVVRTARMVPLHNEGLAIAAGALFSLFFIGFPTTAWPWTAFVWSAMTLAMFALLAWTGYLAITSTRTINELLRLPLEVDPLDPHPFEAIGRQSLALALVFVGGTTLGTLLSGVNATTFLDPAFLRSPFPAFLVLISLVPVLVFYLNMRPTHRVLASARDRALGEVRQELHRSFPTLLRRMVRGEPTGHLPSEVNALVAYKKELDQASTWPYNPVILRTLVVSVLIPTITLLARRVLEVYIR